MSIVPGIEDPRKPATEPAPTPRGPTRAVDPPAEVATAPSDSLAIAIARLKSRTPEQVAADLTRLLAASPPPRPLPPGKTLADVVVGQWPGDETDEQVREALEKLS